MEDKCIECPYAGQGSEHCIAVIGDYCPLIGDYLEETEEDIEFLRSVGYDL